MKEYRDVTEGQCVVLVVSVLLGEGDVVCESDDVV